MYLIVSETINIIDEQKYIITILKSNRTSDLRFVIALWAVITLVSFPKWYTNLNLMLAGAAQF